MIDEEGLVPGHGGVLQRQALPVQRLHIEAELVQGVAAFLRALAAQAVFSPVLRTGMTGLAIGDRDQQQVRFTAAQAGEQAAAGEDLVVGMGRHHHQAPARRAQLLRGDPGGPGQVGRVLPLLVPGCRALEQVFAHSCQAPAGMPASCRPSTARSRSAWLWRRNTGRSAASRAK